MAYEVFKLTPAWSPSKRPFAVFYGRLIRLNNAAVKLMPEDCKQVYILHDRATNQFAVLPTPNGDGRAFWLSKGTGIICATGFAEQAGLLPKTRYPLRWTGEMLEYVPEAQP